MSSTLAKERSETLSLKKCYAGSRLEFMVTLGVLFSVTLSRSP